MATSPTIGTLLFILVLLIVVSPRISGGYHMVAAKSVGGKMNSIMERLMKKSRDQWTFAEMKEYAERFISVHGLMTERGYFYRGSNSTYETLVKNRARPFWVEAAARRATNTSLPDDVMAKIMADEAPPYTPPTVFTDPTKNSLNANFPGWVKIMWRIIDELQKRVMGTIWENKAYSPQEQQDMINLLKTIEYHGFDHVVLKEMSERAWRLYETEEKRKRWLEGEKIEGGVNSFDKYVKKRQIRPENSRRWDRKEGKKVGLVEETLDMAGVGDFERTGRVKVSATPRGVPPAATENNFEGMQKVLIANRARPFWVEAAARRATNTSLPDDVMAQIFANRMNRYPKDDHW